MLAILILFLAALSRLVPHAFHAVAFNFTAVGAGLLFFGSRRPRWQTVLAVAVMGLMDVYLTTQVYHYPFHVRGYLITWVWYAAVCLMGNAFLGVSRKGGVTPLRVLMGVLGSSTSFFLLSNFMVWAGTGSCYAAGVPFYGNDLLSTAFFAAAFFGLPVVAAKMVESGVVREPLA
jgi:hypothetical protein